MSESENKEAVEAEPEEEVIESPAEETISEETATEAEAETVEEAPEEKPEEEAPVAEEEKAEGEEEIEVVEEKIYTIPLRHVWVVTPRGKRAPRSVRDVRDFVARHMKAEEVAVSNEVNSILWSRGINKPPRKISVRAVKDKEGKVIVYPSKTA